MVGLCRQQWGYLNSGDDPINGEVFSHYFLGRADNYIRVGEAVGDGILSLLRTETVSPTDATTVQPTGLEQTPPPPAATSPTPLPSFTS